jgi:hypothetical protein
VLTVDGNSTVHRAALRHLPLDVGSQVKAGCLASSIAREQADASTLCACWPAALPSGSRVLSMPPSGAYRRHIGNRIRAGNTARP